MGAQVLIGCGACQDGLNGIWTDKEMSVEAVIDEARAPARLLGKLCVPQTLCHGSQARALSAPAQAPSRRSARARVQASKQGVRGVHREGSEARLEALRRGALEGWLKGVEPSGFRSGSAAETCTQVSKGFQGLRV